jgi:hypothetical protein
MNYRAVSSRVQLNSDFKVQTSDFIPVCTYAGGTVLLEMLYLQCAQYATPDSKIYCKKVKTCRFSSWNLFFCTKFVQLPWLIKGATQFKKDCNKLDLTAAQYFWLVDHNDWSRWFAISSPRIYAVTVVLVRLPKKNTPKLRHLILLSRVTYWAPVDML